MYSARSATTSVRPFLKAISNGVSLLVPHTPRGTTLQDGKGGYQSPQLPTHAPAEGGQNLACPQWWRLAKVSRSHPQMLLQAEKEETKKVLKTKCHLTHLHEMVGSSLTNSSFSPSFMRSASLVLVKRQKGSDPFPVAISIGDCLNSPVSGTKLGSTLQFTMFSKSCNQSLTNSTYPRSRSILT